MESLEKILELDKLGKGGVDIVLWIADDLYVGITQESATDPVECELVIPSKEELDSLMLSSGLRFVKGGGGQKERYRSRVEQYAEDIKDSYERSSDEMRKTYLDAVIHAHDEDIARFRQERQKMDDLTAKAKGNVLVMRATGNILNFFSFGEMTKDFEEGIKDCSMKYLGWAILARTSRQFAEDLEGFASYFRLHGDKELALNLTRVSKSYQNIASKAEMARKRLENFVKDTIINMAIYAGKIHFDDVKKLENMIYQSGYNSALKVPGSLFGVNVQ